MSTKVVPGQLLAMRETSLVAGEAAKEVANVLRTAIESQGRATIALSGGNTPRDTYARLASDASIDWTKVAIFWVDERVAPPTDDRSNYRWAKATLLDHAPILAENVHRMPTDAADLDAAARDYEKLIRANVRINGAGVPSFDALILGVGDDGHTASLFPGESTVDITDRLVASTPARPGREARMTVTAPIIEHSRNVFVLAVGASKHVPLERIWAVTGDLHETPGRVIRSCRGELIWIIDRAAAGLD